jgi:Flp pilus assembly protein TadG
MRIRNLSLYRHRGATLLETALVLSLIVLVLLGTITLGLGVFRYEQVAELARQGARYASVRGGQYQQETGQAAATSRDVYTQAILPNAIGLTPSNLSYSVSWDDSSRMPLYYTSTGSTWRANNVTVTVAYQWFPELFVTGPIYLSSTAVMPITY